MRYIQDPITHELIPADQYESRNESGIHVMGDIQPYRSMIDGSIITSRSKHREHLRAHGCIEVGNDNSVLKAQRKPLDSPKGLKETLIRVANEKLR
jgi:hypothetical protein